MWPTTKALQKQRLLSACTQLNPIKLCLTELKETEQTEIVLTLGSVTEPLHVHHTLHNFEEALEQAYTNLSHTARPPLLR